MGPRTGGLGRTCLTLQPHQKPGDVAGLLIPQGQKGKRKQLKQRGERGRGGSSLQAAWALGTWKDRAFQFLLPLLHAHPIATNLQRVLPTLATAHTVLSEIPWLSHTSSSTAQGGIQPPAAGSPILLPSYVLFWNNVSGNRSFQLFCGECKAL